MAGSRLTTMIFVGMLLGIAVGYACSITWPDPQTAKEIAGYIALVSDAPEIRSRASSTTIHSCCSGSPPSASRSRPRSRQPSRR